MERFDFIPTHPGEVLKDELEARGIPQKEFAIRTGIPYTMLNDILNGRRPLSAATALLVESALGVSADMLMGLQSDYTMQAMRHDEAMLRRMGGIRPFPLPTAPALA